MFTALTEFLEHFDLPVLAMTATMIERRKETLARCLVVVDGLKFGTTGSPLQQIAEHPRYQVTKVANRDEAQAQVKRALAEGLRVLWVVNTVDRAQELAREFALQPIGLRMEVGDGVPLLCYHSRFKLRDRRERHEEIVAAFRPKTKGRHPLLAITTQVCELSLDLDCDVLITEFAPASSLIQRFGRCCRDQDAHKNGRPAGRVILYKPETAHPYSEEEMKDVPDFVSKIFGRTISQSGLESILADLDNAGFLPKQARFVHDGPWAASGQDNFRDIEDFTRQAILPGDALEYERLTAARDQRWRAQELILPVPKRDTDDTNRPRWMPSWLSFAEAKRHEYLPALGYVAKAGGGYQTA
jgi:CRISPR-associated endonuclease/helicase Cas3